MSTQSELKQLRSNQHNKRADRDKLIKDIVRIRKLEEETRAQITDSKDLDTNLKSGMCVTVATPHRSHFHTLYGYHFSNTPLLGNNL